MRTSDYISLHDLGPGRKLGKYLILSELGRGGMGVVFKAEHELLRRVAAIKIILSDRQSDANTRDRFLREMKTLGRLENEHIVRVYDADEYEGILYYAMEFVDGVDIKSVLDSLKRLPVEVACAVVRQAAIGLQCAHENGLVHRDVKPGNLILAETGIIKVLDFGLAKALEFDEERAGLTVTNAAMGTPHYMAPEQFCDARSVDIRADVYGLGCTFFECLTGQRLFSTARRLSAVKHMHCNSTAPDVRTIRADISDEISILVNSMLAKSPDKRPQIPGEIAERIEDLTADIDLADFYRNVVLAKQGGTEPVDSSAISQADDMLEQIATSTATGVATSRSMQIEPAVPPRDRKESTKYRQFRRRELIKNLAVVFAFTAFSTVVIFAIWRPWHEDLEGATKPSPPELIDGAKPSEKTITASLVAPESIPVPADVDRLEACELIKLIYTEAPPVSHGTTFSQGAAMDVEVLAKREGQDTFQPLDDGDYLSSRSDLFQIRVKPKASGYLYVFQVDASGNASWIFPKNQTFALSDGTNPVAAGSTVLVPASEERAFYLDDILGVEHVFSVLSLERWESLENHLQKERSRSDASIASVVMQPLRLGTRGIGGVRPANADSSGGLQNAYSNLVTIERWFHHIDSMQK